MITAVMGGIDTFGYNLLLVIHIVAVVLAFGPALANTLLLRVAKGTEAGAASSAANQTLLITKRYTLPGLIAAVLAGVLLVVNSADAWAFEQAWVSASFTVVLLLLLLTWFMTLPAQRDLLTSLKGSDALAVKRASGRVAIATGLFHAGFLVILVLMVWKPGV